MKNEKELLTKKAKTVFTDGFHCSLALLTVFADELGIDEITAKKLSGCFGTVMCINSK